MSLRLLITFILFLVSPIIQAEISVSVDRNPVVADESFQLIFKSNEKVKREPDFSPLKKNFTIINTGRRSNTQIINGDIKQSHQWVLTVIANKTGSIQIPSINFDKASSQPYQIEVVASAPPKVGNKTDDIFIDVEVNKKESYVQEQIVYTVKLYRAVQTNNASLSEPEISGDQAVVTKLGEDKSFETRIKGKRYVVIQRQYAVFPQSSGTLKIEPIIFQGQTGSGSFFGFDPFGPQPKSIVKRSDSIVLDIKTIPDSFTGDTWLPASQVNIQEQWSVDPSELIQGEATTRTLIVTANGLASSHLPAVQNKLPDNLKQYPDQPELDEKLDEGGFVGIRREKMAIIPTEAGDFMLPAIKIPWWNTKTNNMEIAELPERSIHVNVSDSIVANDQSTHSNIENEVITSEAKENNANEEEINPISPMHDKTPWQWISLSLFLLWIFTLLVFWKGRKKTIVANNSTTDLSKRQYLNQFKAACKNNDAVVAKDSLLAWSRLIWPNENINSIDSIKLFCNQEFQLKLDKLNGYLYGKMNEEWNGYDFLKSFEAQSFDEKVTVKEKGKLEPLYKS